MKGCDTANSSGNPIEAEMQVNMADPIGTIKNISELIKKYNDLELMKQIVALQTIARTENETAQHGQSNEMTRCNGM
jgi:hypothetical protein